MKRILRDDIADILVEVTIHV